MHLCLSILGLGRTPPFPYQNFGVMGKARAECQGAAQPPINPRDISLFFGVLGLWNNKKKKNF